MASENADFMSTEAPSSSTLSVELPAPTVGAEVDCLGGNDVEGASPELPPSEQQTEEDSQKSASSELPGPSVVLRSRRLPKRLEDKNCSCCKAEFERQGRSFNRKAVYTFTSPETVQWVFPEAVVHDKSFLCEPCAQVIKSKCKRKQNKRKVLWLIPPVENKSELRDKKKKGRRMGKKSKAAQLVSKSRYKAAFKLLWSAKGARKPMMEFWRKQLKQEMKTLMRQTDNPFHQKVFSKKPLSSFPWRRCLNWAQDKAPLVTSCLTSLFPDINALSKSSHQLSEEQAQMLLERRAVVALSIPLFTRNIWKNNFLQAALGAELRLQGSSGSSLDVLNTMGLCQNKDTVRLLLLGLQNGKNANGQRMLKQELLKGEHMADVEEEEEEEEEEDDDDDEEVDGDEDEDEETEDEEEEAVDEEEEAVDEEEEAVDEEEDAVDKEQEPIDEEQEPVDEEQDEEEMEMAVQEEVEVENQVSDEKAEIEKKKRRKKAKKQRNKRGKRKIQEREEEEVEEEEEDDEGSEEKKRRVVVVRLGLLKGHSEVGRSDLSAP